jgi:hypothetical protein
MTGRCRGGTLVTEEVVPWVAYLFATNDQITGPAVVSWDYDQFSDTTAYAHVAVDPDMQ